MLTRWLPPRLSPEDTDRARLVLISWCVSLGILPFILSLHVWREAWGHVAIVGLTLLLTLGLGPLCRRSWIAAADSLCTLITVCVLAVELWEPTVVSLFTLSVVPLMATTFIGIRATIRWSVFEAGIVCLALANYSVRLDEVPLPLHLVALTGLICLGTIALIAALSHTWSTIQARTTAERQRLLREARDSALAANHAKSVFLTNMSHELRTPLNAIIGYSQLLEDEVSSEHHDDLRRIESAGTHLLRLINNVLDLSQVEAGQMVLEPREVRLQTLFSRVSELMEPNRKPSVELVVEPTSMVVFADVDRLVQVLVNLTSNALKFTDSGSVRVAAVRHLDRIELTVTDTGAGMDEETQVKMFERFHRSDTVTQIQGTGLGLPISVELVKLMDGDLFVQSAVGRGTQFTVSLPVPSVSH